VRSLDETLTVLQDELRTVESSLAEPDVASDLNRLRDLSRRHKELAEINHAWLATKVVQDDLAYAREMFNESAGDDREQWREVINTGEAQLSELEATLETLLLPTLTQSQPFSILAIELREELRCFISFFMRSWYLSVRS